MAKNLGLGQGVDILFGEKKDSYFECDVNSIIPNKHQPRTYFNDDDLLELSDSIKEKGVIQPLIVTNESEGKFELVAGERRLRASKMAGLTEVPVVLIDVLDDDAMLELALIENVQRTDLNPIEEAEAYRKLIDNFGYTQEVAARRVGKQRSTISNLLRLLKLPQKTKDKISTGILTEGHGRALLRLVDNPLKLEELQQNIIKSGLSVRQTERLARKSTNNHKNSPKNRKIVSEENIPSSYKNALITQLTNQLNTKIQISENGSRGKIEIEYYSLDDFDRVTALILSIE